MAHADKVAVVAGSNVPCRGGRGAGFRPGGTCTPRV